MLTVAICDDENYMLDELSHTVREFLKENHIHARVLQFRSGDDLLSFENQIDILFLDIQMKRTDGMETAKRLRASGFQGFLIFITILKDFVFQAFEVQAFDYLVKPVKKTCLMRTMQRLLASMRDATEKSLLIQRGAESMIIPFDDIVFCEIIDRKIYLHLQSSKVIDYYEKIEALEAKLDNRFFKCHRSYLINLKYLRGYKSKSAYMSDNTVIPVSRLRSREFSEIVLQYMKEQR